MLNIKLKLKQNDDSYISKLSLVVKVIIVRSGWVDAKNLSSKTYLIVFYY